MSIKSIIYLEWSLKQVIHKHGIGLKQLFHGLPNLSCFTI